MSYLIMSANNTEARGVPSAPTREAAIAEASIMAKKNPGVAISIYELVGSVKAEIEAKVEMFAANAGSKTE